MSGPGRRVLERHVQDAGGLVSDVPVGELALLMLVAFTGAIVVKTWGASAEAVTAGTWIGGVLLGLATLAALARAGRS